jgi:GntR family transcriptional regulator/MocR family aminotransferase
VESLRPLPPPGAVPSGHRLAYDFRYGRPALEAFPQALWTRLVTRRARALSTRSLGYGRPRGLPALREAIADYLRRARGVRADAEQVLIVNGTQQALDLAGRLLLDPGDRVVVEEPGYQAASQLFSALGARLCPTPVDADGLRVAELPRGKVRLAYVTPSHQFPLGGVLSLERRFALLRWAEATGAHLLEDDYDAEFRYDARPLEAVQGLDRAGRVLYVGSFSKVLFPSLRIGYLVVPGALVSAAASLKFLMDCATPTFEQEVLADFLAEGHFERHLRTMRALYARRRAVILEALQQGLGERLEVAGADAGLHLVLYLRGLTSAAVPGFVARAAERGLGIYPLAPYHLRGAKRAGLILGYAGLTEGELRAGARLFSELARSLRG